MFPLRLLMILGMFAIGFSILAAMFLLIGNWTDMLHMGNDISYLTALMILIGGTTMFGIGVVGEYVGRIYQEVKQRPIYVVRRRGMDS